MVKLGFRIPKYYEPAEREPYRKTMELAILAEEAGFDFGTFGHRVVMPDSPNHAAPIVALAAVAARTTRLRLATSIYVLPFHHPITVAEQIGQLDQISGGRVIFGVGIGYRDYEFAAYGLSRADRVARTVEAMQAIREGWRRGYFEFSGKHFNIPRSPVDPVPIQAPHPPMWMGGAAEPAVKRAARYADGWLSNNTMTSDGIAGRVASYARYCEEEGHPLGTVTVVRNAWVAGSRAEVERDWLPEVLKFQLDYQRAGVERPGEDGSYARLLSTGNVKLEDFVTEWGIAGTPEDCIAQIERWRAKTGCDYMNLMFTGAGGFEAHRKVIQMFGREVIPALSS